jgi:hypothetical protein
MRTDGKTDSEAAETSNLHVYFMLFLVAVARILRNIHKTLRTLTHEKHISHLPFFPYNVPLEKVLGHPCAQFSKQKTSLLCLGLSLQEELFCIYHLFLRSVDV